MTRLVREGRQLACGAALRTSLDDPPGTAQSAFRAASVCDSSYGYQHERATVYAFDATLVLP